VGEASGRLRFTFQPLLHAQAFGRIVKVVKPDGLQGHFTADHRVEAFVDDTHAAAAEFSRDLKWAESGHNGKYSPDLRFLRSLDC